MTSIAKQRQISRRQDAAQKYLRGESIKDLGAHYGITRQGIIYWLRREGVAIVRNRDCPRSIPLEQHGEIVSGYERGISSPALAVKYHCSAQHICNILRLHGIEPRHPKATSTVKHRLPSDYLKQFDCTRADRDALADSNHPTQSNWARYKQQRMRAKQRGIEWQFTFPTWWKTWQDSGKWPERSVAGYVMARYGDSGPYSPTNVHIILQADNMRETHQNHRAKGLTVRGKRVSACSRNPLQVHTSVME